jgi:hypothetical protein
MSWVFGDEMFDVVHFCHLLPSFSQLLLDWLDWFRLGVFGSIFGPMSFPKQPHISFVDIPVDYVIGQGESLLFGQSFVLVPIVLHHHVKSLHLVLLTIPISPHLLVMLHYLLLALIQTYSLPLILTTHLEQLLYQLVHLRAYPHSNHDDYQSEYLKTSHSNNYDSYDDYILQIPIRQNSFINEL